MSREPKTRNATDIDRVTQPVPFENQDHVKANFAAQIDLLRILVRNAVMQVSGFEVVGSSAIDRHAIDKRKRAKSKAVRPPRNRTACTKPSEQSNRATDP